MKRKISAEEKEKLKEQVKAQLEKESWVIEFIRLTNIIKIAFEYQTQEKTIECVEVLEETKAKIRELQSSLLKGRGDSKMHEMQQRKYKEFA